MHLNPTRTSNFEQEKSSKSIDKHNGISSDSEISNNNGSNFNRVSMYFTEPCFRLCSNKIPSFKGFFSTFKSNNGLFDLLFRQEVNRG